MGSSKISAMCLALAMYLQSCSGRQLHSLKKWLLSGQPACLQSGQDLVSLIQSLAAKRSTVVTDSGAHDLGIIGSAYFVE